MVVWQFYQTQKQFSSSSTNLPTQFFPDITGTATKQVRITVFDHKPGFDGHLYQAAAADQLQALNGSSSSTVRKLCASSHAAGSECSCYQPDTPVLGPYPATLGLAKPRAGYSPELRLTRIKHNKELLAYRQYEDPEYVVLLFVKDGPASLQVHIMHRDHLPGTISSIAMNCKLVPTNQARVRLHQPLVQSQWRKQQLPMVVVVELHVDQAAGPALPQLLGTITPCLEREGGAFLSVSVPEVGISLQQLCRYRVVRAAVEAEGSLITLTLVETAAVETPAPAPAAPLSSLASAAAGAPGPSRVQHLLQRSSSSSSGQQDYLSLVNDRLPSLAELDGAAMQEQDLDQPPQPRAFVTAADGFCEQWAGVEEAQQEVQRAMPELLQGLAPKALQVLLAALQRSDASGGVAVLSALVLDPGLMDRVAALDMEQQSVCAAALAALAEACPTISATGSVGYILMGRSGAVESVVNGVLQSTLAALVEQRGVLQPMLEAAPDAAALLTDPVSRAQLLEGDTLAKVRDAFRLDTQGGRTINYTVWQRDLESVLHFLACTALTRVEQLPELLSPLLDKQRVTAHFSRSNCDPTWLAKALLAGADGDPVFINALPAMVNLYPVAKLMLAVVELECKVKVSCSLQALTSMLVDQDMVQVHDGPSDCMDLAAVLNKLVGIVASNPAAVELVKTFAPSIQAVVAAQAIEQHTLADLALLQASELQSSDPVAAYKAKERGCKQVMHARGLANAASMLAAAQRVQGAGSSDDSGASSSSRAPDSSSATSISSAPNSSSAAAGGGGGGASSSSSQSSAGQRYTPPLAITALMIPEEKRDSVTCAIKCALKLLGRRPAARVAECVGSSRPAAAAAVAASAAGDVAAVLQVEQPPPAAGASSAAAAAAAAAGVDPSAPAVQQQPAPAAAGTVAAAAASAAGDGAAVLQVGQPPPPAGASSAAATAVTGDGAAALALDGLQQLAPPQMPLLAAAMQPATALVPPLPQQEEPPQPLSSALHMAVSQKRVRPGQLQQQQQQQQQHEGESFEDEELQREYKRPRMQLPQWLSPAEQQRMLENLLPTPAQQRQQRAEQEQLRQVIQRERERLLQQPTQKALQCLTGLTGLEQKQIDFEGLQHQLERSEQRLLQPSKLGECASCCTGLCMELEEQVASIRASSVGGSSRGLAIVRALGEVMKRLRSKSRF